MVKKIITPSRHKNICQKLHHFDQLQLAKNIELLEISNVYQEQIGWYKWKQKAFNHCVRFQTVLMNDARTRFKAEIEARKSIKRYCIRCLLKSPPGMLRTFPKMR